jgi:hypothetical protein
MKPVLRIRDVYPGSEFFPYRIHGRNDSRILDPDPHQRIEVSKNLGSTTLQEALAVTIGTKKVL